jgi:hypothetical protein
MTEKEPRTDIRRFRNAAILLIVLIVVVASAWILGNGRWLPAQIPPEQEAEHLPPPDGYLSVEDYPGTRRHEFPALHPTPPPAPVGECPGSC